MHLFLAVTPEYAQAASKFRGTPVHVAYRIGPDSTLLRQNLLLQSRGGLLSVSDRDAPRIDDPDALLRSSCCENAGAAAIPEPCWILKSRSAPTVWPSPAASGLPATQAPQNPLSAGNPAREAGQQAVILLAHRLCPAETSLNASGKKYAAAAPDIWEWTYSRRRGTHFRLPALVRELPESGNARPTQRAGIPYCIFLPDLCARYFTYSRSGETHFVLFDDAGTIAQKLRIGTSLGLSAAFFMWPEIQDIAGDLFRIL